MSRRWWVACALAIVVGVGTGVLVDRFVVGPLRRRTRSPLRLLLLSVGVSQVLLALTFVPDLNPDRASARTPRTACSGKFGTVC